MSGVAAVIDCSALVRTLTDHGTGGVAVRRRLAGVESLAAPGLLDYEDLRCRRDPLLELASRIAHTDKAR